MDMTPLNINEALAQIKEIRQVAIGRQRFKGYSGAARALCGTLALATAVISASDFYPHNVQAQADAWAYLFAVSVIINFGALLRWFFSNAEIKRDLRRLLPTMDMLPPLLVGCALTIIMVIHLDFQYLYGVWLCCCGLINMAQDRILPASIRMVGFYYIVCGIAVLLLFRVDFMNPWPMGFIVFFGEWWGGIVYHLNRIDSANIFDAFRVTKWS